MDQRDKTIGNIRDRAIETIKTKMRGGSALNIKRRKLNDGRILGTFYPPTSQILRGRKTAVRHRSKRPKASQSRKRKAPQRNKKPKKGKKAKKRVVKHKRRREHVKKIVDIFS